MDFSVILFPLKLTRNRIYTAPAAQRLIHFSSNSSDVSVISKPPTHGCAVLVVNTFFVIQSQHAINYNKSSR